MISYRLQFLPLFISSSFLFIPLSYNTTLFNIVEIFFIFPISKDKRGYSIHISFDPHLLMFNRKIFVFYHENKQYVCSPLLQAVSDNCQKMCHFFKGFGATLLLEHYKHGIKTSRMRTVGR